MLKGKLGVKNQLSHIFLIGMLERWYYIRYIYLIFFYIKNVYEYKIQ